jgi:hypothetical protein
MLTIDLKTLLLPKKMTGLQTTLTSRLLDLQITLRKDMLLLRTIKVVQPGQPHILAAALVQVLARVDLGQDQDQVILPRVRLALVSPLQAKRSQVAPPQPRVKVRQVIARAKVRVIAKVRARVKV